MTVPDTEPRPGTTAVCTRDSRLSGALLGYGILAGPVYVLTSLVQAATRTGFDLSRHSWSQLALGPMGWVQTLNLLLTGLMVIAGSVGIHRVGIGTGHERMRRTGPTRAAWGCGLTAVFGLSMIVAAAFRADPAGGFTVGVPQATSVGAGGLVHLAAGAIGFIAVAVGLLLLARPLQAAGARRLSTLCRVVAPAFLAAFLTMASGASGRPGVIAFTVGVVAVFGVFSLVCWDRFRRRDADI